MQSNIQKSSPANNVWNCNSLLIYYPVFWFYRKLLGFFSLYRKTVEKAYVLSSQPTYLNFIYNLLPIGLLAGLPRCVVSALRVLWDKILKWADSCWERIRIICSAFPSHVCTHTRTHTNTHTGLHTKLGTTTSSQTLRLSHPCVPCRFIPSSAYFLQSSCYFLIVIICLIP